MGGCREEGAGRGALVASEGGEKISLQEQMSEAEAEKSCALAISASEQEMVKAGAVSSATTSGDARHRATPRLMARFLWRCSAPSAWASLTRSPATTRTWTP